MPKINTAAPPHLSAASQALWRDVLTRYLLEPQQEAVLTLALESFDAAKRARRSVQKEGAAITTKRGARIMNPNVRVQRDCAITFSRLMASLGLSSVDPAMAGRKPLPVPVEDPASLYLD